MAWLVHEPAPGTGRRQLMRCRWHTRCRARNAAANQSPGGQSLLMTAGGGFPSRIIAFTRGGLGILSSRLCLRGIDANRPPRVQSIGNQLGAKTVRDGRVGGPPATPKTDYLPPVVGDGCATGRGLLTMRLAQSSSCSRATRRAKASRSEVTTCDFPQCDRHNR